MQYEPKYQYSKDDRKFLDRLKKFLEDQLGDNADAAMYWEYIWDEKRVRERYIHLRQSGWLKNEAFDYMAEQLVEEHVAILKRRIEEVARGITKKLPKRSHK